MNGFGSFTWIKSEKKYVGQWKNNMMDGKGTFIWKNGQKFTGGYVKDKKHGPGILYLSDSTKIEANWHDGNFDGKGKIYLPTG